MSEFKTTAINKLKAEEREYEPCKYGRVMKRDILNALIKFINQDDEFAQAIAQSNKTFSDCMGQIVKGIGSSISDIDAYKRAVSFYFKGADIHCTMTINLCGSVSDDTDNHIEMTSYTEPVKPQKAKASSLMLSLDDLLD